MIYKYHTNKEQYLVHSSWKKEPQSAFMFDWTVCTNVSDLNWSVSVCRTATYTKDRWLLALHFHANNVFYTKIQLTGTRNTFSCPWISPLSVLIMASLLFDSSHCLNQCRRYNKLDHHQDKVDKYDNKNFHTNDEKKLHLRNVVCRMAVFCLGLNVSRCMTSYHLHVSLNDVQVSHNQYTPLEKSSCKKFPNLFFIVLDIEWLPEKLLIWCVYTW